MSKDNKDLLIIRFTKEREGLKDELRDVYSKQKEDGRTNEKSLNAWLNVKLAEICISND